MPCSITVTALDANESPLQNQVVTAKPSVAVRFQLISGVWSEVQYGYRSTTTDATGSATLSLPWPSVCDPSSIQWVITAPTGAKYVGIVPEGVSGPLTLKTLKDVYGWGLAGVDPYLSPVIAVQGPPSTVTNVQANGVKGDGTDETAAIQAVFNAAPANSIIEFPQPTVEYLISAAIAVKKPGLRIRGTGSNCAIRQATYKTPIFDVYDAGATNAQVPDVSIDGFYLKYTGSRTYAGGGASFRGDDPYAYGAGVWTASPRTRVTNTRVFGFTSGIYFSAWNGTATTAGVTDCSAENILVDTCDFGILAVGQTNLRIDGLRGSYTRQSGSPNPPHLIYTSGNGVAPCANMAIDNCVAHDCAEGHAYQFKGVQGAVIGSLYAYNCNGLLSLANGNDIAIAELVGVGDISGNNSFNPVASIYFQGVGETRIAIAEARLAQTTDFQAVRLDGTDCTLQHLMVQTARAQTGSATDVTVQGARNRINRAKFVNTDATNGVRNIQLNSGDGHVVRDVESRGATQMVNVSSSSVTNAIVEIDPALFTPATALAANGSVAIVDIGTSTRVTRKTNLVSKTCTAGVLSPDTYFDSTRYDRAIVTVNDSTTITVPAPSNGIAGQTFTYDILNSSGGGISQAFGSACQVDQEWRAPGNTKHHIITFWYDGTNWREIWRSNHTWAPGQNASMALSTGAGTGASLAASALSDRFGWFSILTAGTPAATAIIATLTFNNQYSTAPRVVILTPANAAAAALTGNQQIFVNQGNIGTQNFTISSGSTGLTTAVTYQWYYEVLGGA
jgi:hypothetical protein